MSSHPLETRLKAWESTQHDLKMNMLRRTYGMGEPIRRELELKAVRNGTWRPAALGGRQPNLQEDILAGRDTSITWEDIFTGDATTPIPGFHDEMEKKLKI